MWERSKILSSCQWRGTDICVIAISVLGSKLTGKTHFHISFNLLGPELFFLVLAHPVYKMRIIHEPNPIEL